MTPSDPIRFGTLGTGQAPATPGRPVAGFGPPEPRP